MLRAVRVERFSLSSVVLRAVLRGSHVRFPVRERVRYTRGLRRSPKDAAARPRTGGVRGKRRKDVRAVKKTGIPKALAWTPTSTIVPSIDWVLPKLRPPKSIVFQV